MTKFSRRPARYLALAGGLSILAFAAALKPNDVNIAGSLDYGQTSPPFNYTGTPKYAAFVFNGMRGDQVGVTIHGGDRPAALSIADGSLNELKSGSGELSFEIPDHGPDPETYYIVFRDPLGKPATYTIELTKKERGAAN